MFVNERSLQYPNELADKGIISQQDLEKVKEFAKTIYPNLKKIVHELK
jgi:hypothetical protein